MGIQDRDWYREAVRDRERQLQKKFRTSAFVRRSPAAFSPWASAVKTVVYCLAIYGALSLIKRFFG